MRNTSCSYHLFHNKTPLWLPAWPYLCPKSGDIILSVDNGLHQFTVNMVIITVKLNHSLVTNHRGTQNTVRGEWGASFLSFSSTFLLTVCLRHSLQLSIWNCLFCKMKNRRDEPSRKHLLMANDLHRAGMGCKSICWVIHHWLFTK